jgi:hypothetical protein
LKELTLAVDAGQRLDFLTPKLSVAGRYSYGIVQRVLDIPNNRSLVSIEGSYWILEGRLQVNAVTIWQRTHGGLRAGTPWRASDGTPPPDLVFPGDLDHSPERVSESHRIMRDNYFHGGGGASYFFHGLGVFGSYVYNVSGTDTHPGERVHGRCELAVRVALAPLMQALSHVEFTSRVEERKDSRSTVRRHLR